jgi:DNA-binding winged helix-turn-helix (wHTH) protein
MQVLVALARARGEIVTRDQLIASCWGGLAVGDDAINRCVGVLRRLAESETPAVFSLETIARVGYRLWPLAPAAAVPPRRPPPHKREKTRCEAVRASGA